METVAAWFAKVTVTPHIDGPGMHSLNLTGAFPGTVLEVHGTREDLLDYAESIRRAAEALPSDD